MKTFVTFQPYDRPDHLTTDGTVLYQKPWALSFFLDGTPINPETVGELVTRIVGFTKDPSRQEVDLFWSSWVRRFNAAPADSADFEALMDETIGSYMVTLDGNGGMGAHETAVQFVTVRTGTEE